MAPAVGAAGAAIAPEAAVPLLLLVAAGQSASASTSAVSEAGGCMPSPGALTPGIDTQPCVHIPRAESTCPAEYNQWAEPNRQLLDSATVQTVTGDGYLKQSYYDSSGNFIGVAEMATLSYGGEVVATNYYQVANSFRNRYLGTDLLFRTMVAWKNKFSPPAKMKIVFADINSHATGNRCYWSRVGGMRGMFGEGDENLPYHLVRDIPLAP